MGKNRFRGPASFSNGGGHDFDALSNKVIGASITVHKALGPGFLESIYEEALSVELTRLGINFEKQKQVEIFYCDVKVGKHRLDMVVNDSIIVELKTAKDLIDTHYAQLRSYLKATGLQIGLLLNFAKPTLEVKRIVN